VRGDTTGPDLRFEWQR